MEYSAGSNVGELGAIVLAVGLAATSLTDLHRRSIPNYLTGPLFVVGIGLNVEQDGWGGFLKSAVGCMVALAIVWWFYRRGSLGAGDVKLFIAIGAVTGPIAPISIGVYSLAFASAVAFASGTGRTPDTAEPSQSVPLPMAPVFACATMVTNFAPLIPL